MRKTIESLGIALIVAVFASACSSPPNTGMLAAEDIPDALAFDATTSDDAPASTPAAAFEAATDEPRCAAGWDAVVAPVFGAVDILLTEISTEPVGQGCRSFASTSTGEITVLLEPTSAEVVEQLLNERDPTGSFMGFTELDFLATDVWASSSLLHPGLDRLVETRWLILDAENGVRIEVTVDGGADAGRVQLLEHIDTLEATAAAYQVAGNAHRLVTENAWASNEHAVDASAALIVVIDHVASTQRLGALATEDGADAIAFEYAFPENVAALRSSHRPTDCTADEEAARCVVAAGASRYVFDFVPIDGEWLLDDFALILDAGPGQ